MVIFQNISMKKLIFVCFYLFLNYVSVAQNFLSEIKAFEKEDSIAMPLPNDILLVGSSSFRIWKEFKEYLAGFSVINRGFGGSQMSDVNFYFERIVTKYRPKLIVVYEGDNDLNAGKSPETVLTDYQTFAQKVKEQLPQTRVIFMSVRPSLARIKLKNEQAIFNRSIKKYCKQNKRFYYMDIQKEFYLSNGELMTDIFLEDKLHLNKKGYEIWTKALIKVLKKHY